MEVQRVTILHEVAYDEREQMYCCCDSCDPDTDMCCFTDPTSSNCTDFGTCDVILTICLDYNGNGHRQCVRSNDFSRSEFSFVLFSSLASPNETIYNRLYFFGDEYPSNVSHYFHQLQQLMKIKGLIYITIG